MLKNNTCCSRCLQSLTSLEVLVQRMSSIASTATPSTQQPRVWASLEHREKSYNGIRVYVYVCMCMCMCMCMYVCMCMCMCMCVITYNNCECVCVQT